MSGAVRWLVQSAAQLPDGDAWLSAGELSRQAGLRYARRRADWRLGRWTAKLAICRHLGRPDEELPRIEIRSAPDGAPEALLVGRPLALALSLSHSGGRALCALAPGAAIGCDLETVEPRSERFVDDYFTAGERRMVERAPEGSRAIVANLIWSAKESALKLLRQGLRLDTRTVELISSPRLDGRGWRALELRHRGPETRLGGWWRPLGRQVMTVVTAGPGG